jgi:hypothetical protein
MILIISLLLVVFPVHDTCLLSDIITIGMAKRSTSGTSEMERRMEFYKSTTERMQNRLRQVEVESNFMTATITRLEKEKNDMAFLYEKDVSERDETIARLRLRTMNENEDLGFDPVPPPCSNSGGQPPENEEKNLDAWVRKTTMALRGLFPDPVKLNLALTKLAHNVLTASDVCKLLKLRKTGLRECIPADFMDAAIRKGQEDYRNFLQANITPALAENLCKTLLLSRRKYERLNTKLFQTVCRKPNGEVGHMHLRFNGVAAPCLPSRRARDKYKAAIAEVFEHKTADDGLSTSLNVRAVLKAAVLSSIAQGYLVIVDGCVKQPDGRDVQVMKYTDTANQFKGLQVTASAVQLPDGSCAPNSPFHTSEYALYEGGDGYEDITLLGRHEIEQANDLLANLYLDLGPITAAAEGPMQSDGTIPARVVLHESVTCRMEFSLGGDQSHANGMHCLAGCNCTNPCIYCECPRENMCDLDFDNNTCVSRTRHRIMLLAHTALGTCPGCSKQIVPKGEVTDSAAQCELANDGDNQPEVPPEFKVLGRPRQPVTWASLHKGVKYGRTPPYKTEPTNWITCILHLNLCIVRGLFTRTIVAELGKLPQAKGAQHNTFTKLVDAMAELLCSAGLKIKKNKLTKTKGNEVGKYDERLKNSGLGGRDAEHVMNARNAILQMMYPEASCGPWIPDHILFASEEDFEDFYQEAENSDCSVPAVRNALMVRRLWFMWDRTWKLLNSPLEIPAGLTLEEVKQVWATRATAVEEYAKSFLRSWVGAVGSTQGLYLHILVRHIPDQIRKFGDLRCRQTQGLEHCHHCRKEVGIHATNRIRGQRLEQMLAFSSLRRAAMQFDEVAMIVSKAENDRVYKAKYAKEAVAKHQRLLGLRDVMASRTDLLVNGKCP